jgi:hypothetical protein
MLQGCTAAWCMVYASRKDSNHDAPAEHADGKYGGGDDMLETRAVGF